jgi:hypothetical protein
MPDNVTLELLARADCLQAEAHIQIAISREVRSQSAVLLRCLNDGIAQINAMESRTRLPLLPALSSCSASTAAQWF